MPLYQLVTLDFAGQLGQNLGLVLVTSILLYIFPLTKVLSFNTKNKNTVKQTLNQTKNRDQYPYH